MTMMTKVLLVSFMMILMFPSWICMIWQKSKETGTGVKGWRNFCTGYKFIWLWVNPMLAIQIMLAMSAQWCNDHQKCWMILIIVIYKYLTVTTIRIVKKVKKRKVVMIVGGASKVGMNVIGAWSCSGRGFKTGRQTGHVCTMSSKIIVFDSQQCSEVFAAQSDNTDCLTLKYMCLSSFYFGWENEICWDVEASGSVPLFH